MTRASFRAIAAGLMSLLPGCSMPDKTFTSAEPLPARTIRVAGREYTAAELHRRYLEVRDGKYSASPASSSDSPQRYSQAAADRPNRAFGLAAAPPAPPVIIAGGVNGAYDPVVSMVATGSVLDVEGTVSPDRRYVTMTLRPQVTSNLQMFTYAVNVTSTRTAPP